VTHDELLLISFSLRPTARRTRANVTLRSLRESLELDARVGLERLTATRPGRDIAAVVLKKRPRVLGRNEPAQRRLSRPEAVEGERLGLSAKAAHGAGESYGPLVILELQP